MAIAQIGPEPVETECRAWTLGELRRLPRREFGDLAVNVREETDPDLWEQLACDLREDSAAALLAALNDITGQMERRAADLAAEELQVNYHDNDAYRAFNEKRASVAAWRAKALGFRHRVEIQIGEFEHAASLTVNAGDGERAEHAMPPLVVTLA